MHTSGGQPEETLLGLFTQHVRRGSIIHRYSWRSFDDLLILPGYGYQHKTVNNNVYYEDPVTNAHIQNIKSGWNQVKVDIKAANGMSRDHLDDYLHETMWGNRFNKEFLEINNEELFHTFRELSFYGPLFYIIFRLQYSPPISSFCSSFYQIDFNMLISINIEKERKKAINSMIKYQKC